MVQSTIDEAKYIPHFMGLWFSLKIFMVYIIIELLKHELVLAFSTQHELYVDRYRTDQIAVYNMALNPVSMQAMKNINLLAQ